ncbi:hypothetical protein ACGFNU_36790 [Spirillospora sp. NPDC048911]|uniref:hypothetical protein n=1 Tax=Spirillospora sp. NPDC048911 TaxID=3364527 RepID=UPI00372078C1
MTVRLFGEPGGRGDAIASFEETGAPADAPCWVASMTNDDDTKSVFLATQFDAAAAYREFHGAGTFDMPGLQPVTIVTIKDRTG